MTPDPKQYFSPAAAQITIQEIKERGHYFTVKELKTLLEKVDDDVVVAIHRMEDHHFKSSGHNGWKAIKALWDQHSIQEEHLSIYQKTDSSLPEHDPTLFEIVQKEDGSYVGKDYIDAIPGYQAILVSARGETKEKVLVITPHY